MFICSVKMTRKKAAVLGCTLAVMLGGSVFWSSLQKGETVSAPSVVQNGSASKSKEKISYIAKDNQERITFLQQFGYETLSEPDEVTEVLIPFEFDETYQAYNEMQKGQKLDLTKYKGKRVKRYTYTITNYPAEQLEKGEKVVANLLVADNKIIGGDVSSQKENGVFHGFVLVSS